MQQAPLQPAAAPGAPAVSLRGASFAWGADQPAVLSDISLQAAAGQLVMVVGEVGSGKSSLLAGILGELRTTAVRDVAEVSSLYPILYTYTLYYVICVT